MNRNGGHQGNSSREPWELGSDPGMQTLLGLFTGEVEPVLTAEPEGLGVPEGLEAAEGPTRPEGTEGTVGQEQDGTVRSPLWASAGGSPGQATEYSWKSVRLPWMVCPRLPLWETETQPTPLFALNWV